MDNKYYGPYKITKVISDNAYQLDLGKSRAHKTVNVSFLKKYKGEVKDDSISPLPIEEEPDVYEVEEIIESRKAGRSTQYLVKWKGYDEPTWEPQKNILDKNLIKDFQSRTSGRRSQGGEELQQPATSTSASASANTNSQ